MRKILKFHIIGLALLMAGISACDTASQEASPIISPDNKPTANFVSEFTGTTFTEGDTISVSVSTTAPIDRALTFSAHVIGGTADDSDIEVIPGVIAPYTTEAVVKIIFVQDWAADEAETAQIEVGLFSMADKYLVHTNTQNPILNLNITNFKSDIITIVCDWEKDVVINSNETYHPDYTYIEHAGSNVDFDFEVYFNDVDYVGGAGTGDCPEVIELDETELANGTYYVYSFLWANDFDDWDVYEEPETVQHTNLPITTTYSQQGVFGEIVSNQDPLTYTNTADFDYDDYGVIDYRLVAVFEYTDGVVNVLEYDGTDLGGAKKLKTPRRVK